MNILSVRRYAAMVPVALSISLLIYFLATYAKVPIRVTLTPLSITVEINPDQSTSRFNLLQDVTEMRTAFNGEGREKR